MRVDFWQRVRSRPRETVCRELSRKSHYVNTLQRQIEGRRDELARRVRALARQKRPRANRGPTRGPTDCQSSPIAPLRSLTPMRPTSRPANSSDDLHPDLVNLGEFVEGLPSDLRQRAEPLLERVVETMKRRRRILTLLQDSLSQLRLDMKYLVFDLEATRRERDTYRRQAGGGASPPDAPRGSDD